MYIVEIKFGFENENISNLTDVFFEQIFFNPNKMDYLINFNETLKQNLPFEKDFFKELLDLSPDSIVLKEDRNEFIKKFKIKFVNIEKTEMLQNVTFEIIVNEFNDRFKEIVFSFFSNLQAPIYLICYNFDDVWFNKQNDLSFGSYEIIKGYNFIAAPLMCFGKKYENVIDFSSLDKLKTKINIKSHENEMICINLFDIQEFPVSDESRKTQKIYWNFLNDNNILEKFSKKTNINFFDFLKKNTR